MNTPCLLSGQMGSPVTKLIPLVKPTSLFQAVCDSHSNKQYLQAQQRLKPAIFQLLAVHAFTHTQTQYYDSSSTECLVVTCTL